MTFRKQFVAAWFLTGLFPAAVLGFQPMTATVRVSSGVLYDYVVIGEHPKATDGYDNAYDTITPGNLNASMGEPFIAVVVVHPDWKPAFRELRGDIRSPANRQEWQLEVSSSLPTGTPLVVELQSERQLLPTGGRLTLRGDGKEADLKAGSHRVKAPGPGKATRISIIAEQP